jgi:alpha,alpha-trehalose phosphorylase
MNAIRTYQRHHQPAAVVAGLANLFPARIDGISLKEQGSGGNAPRLPAGLTGLAVTLRLQHNRLKVEITSTTKTYRILDGQPLPLLYYGQRLTLALQDRLAC